MLQIDGGESKKRVLISLFGSAGDLLPLLSLAKAIQEDGHDVRLAVPRALGLYARLVGIPSISIGNGSEMRVLHDTQLVSNRFGGWASWRHLFSDYIRPTLVDDVKVIESVLTRWWPHVVVNGSFSACGRVVAYRLGLPTIDYSIYPQHLEAASAGFLSRFARGTRQQIATLIGDTPGSAVVTQMMWGPADGHLLHDPALLGTRRTGGREAIGFPYFDGTFGDGAAVEMVAEWRAAQPHSPLVLVTLGSFLGARREATLAPIIEAIRSVGARAIVVGPVSTSARNEACESAAVRTIGPAPMSRLLEHADAVVHHGGIGTMFAALRAGLPSITCPQAFDQGWNGGLLERQGLTIVQPSTSWGWSTAVNRILTSSAMAERVARLRDSLIPSNTVVDRMLGDTLSAPVP